MDILYTQPLTRLMINNPDNRKVDTVVCISEYGHSIGFMMGSFYGNEYFKKINHNVIEAYDKTHYQCMGSVLCNRLYPTLKSIPGNPVNLGMEAVYIFDADNTDSIFKKTFSLNNKPYTIGLHWYGGDKLAGEFLNKTSGGLKNIPESTIGNLLINYKIKDHGKSSSKSII
jgi:hypothetical protein